MYGKKKAKQKTLFQAWNKGLDSATTALSKLPDERRVSSKSNSFSAQHAAKMVSEPVDLTDDDLIEAAELLESTMNDIPGPSNIFRKEVEHIPGFDNSLGDLWIYPTNYPVRDYQFSIVKNALMKNTLVSLPTGLGKTFIGAVIMYNFYRWYPQGKIIFMAPTKPLVSQQIEACHKIMGIPMEDQAEITGMTTSVHKREALWSSKRVFFLTPQVINNDLARGVCPAMQIKCVVIDEAHKAQGKHAYCQVINQLVSCNRNFRVLALSATPGTDVKSVQQVITNLLISHIEIRLEESIDIQKFSHQRKVEKVVCKLDETMITMRNNYLKVIEIFTKSLVNRRALFERETSNYSKYGILMARDQFRKDPPPSLNKYEMGAIEGDFATCISLLHGLELLQQHGMRSFFIFIKAMMEKGNMRAQSVLGANPLFQEIYQNLTCMFGLSPNPTVLLTQAGQTQQQSMQKAESSTQSSNYVYSHPKIAKLEEVVVQHFQSFIQNNENDTTRVMVFCQYRDSVQEITELLQKHRPLIRAMQFVGHSTASGKIAKFTQKDQLKVISKFRAGGYNTLISTCVGEEGLDIGDVDLIVCFDAHKSPIRLVQRMGRTGRKRKGTIVMLVTEGKEERDYNSSLSNKKSIQKAITGNSGRSLQFYQHNPRMIPNGLNPKPLKMHMTIKEKSEPRKDAKKTNKKKPRKTENTDISVIMKNSEIRNSVFLNPEQVKDWDEKLKLSVGQKEQLKMLPSVSRIHCLEGRKMDFKNSLPDRPCLSLSEWTLWQTRLQDSKLSGHSSTTRDFVEIMEICDLIKQSDDENFDENLAPFLGGNYNKSKMESGKMSTKLDGYLTKEKKLSKMIGEVLKNKDSPQKLSMNDDFVSEKPKKIFPERSTFKHKLSLSPDDKDLEIFAKDDTLHGIESILVDHQDIIVESINENRAKNDLKPPILRIGHTSPECLPDFDVGDLNMDDRSNPPAGEIEKENKEADNEQETKTKSSQEIEKFKKSDHGFGVESSTYDQNNPLLNFVNTLSVVPTQTVNMKNSGQAVGSSPEESSKPPTPASFNSISLDFMDNFGSDASDEGESAKELNSSKRACFSLGSDSNDTVEITTVKNDIKPASLPVVPPQCPTEVLSDMKMAVISNSSSQHKEKDSDLSSNLGIERITSDKHHAASTSLQTHSGSADMFAPQFDIDFDLGGFEDEYVTEAIGKENTSLSGPVLASKKKYDNGGGSGAKPRTDRVESSLARVMLSQKFDNQAVFPDWRKIQSGTNVPVAEVKPQRLGNTSTDNSEDIGSSDHHFVHRGTNLVQQETDTKQLELKRKRVNDCPENTSSKRVKNSEYGAFASPKMLTKTPKTDQNLYDSEDSPLIKRKRPLQSKKLQFSPDNANSQPYTLTSEGENEDLSKLTPAERKMITSNRNELSKCKDVESPFIPYKKVLQNHRQYKHSTPKYATPNMIESDPSDDDDFEGSIKCTTKNQRRVDKTPVAVACRKKEIFRGKMKDFINDEAEVSDDGVKVSSDEDETIDHEELKIMRDFVNDATILTQHVTDGSAIDEQAMYLQRNPDFFEEEGRPNGNNGKYKLAYGVGNNLDVFSQEVVTDVSGYEEDSFVCDDVECGDDPAALGEVTLLDELPLTDGRERRITRKQAELKNLQQMNYNASSSSPIVDKLKKVTQKDKPTRKRILCFDDSTDSMEIGHKSPNPNTQVQEKKSCESNPESWSCPACTLTNKSTSRLCELCDCENPNSEEENAATISETWTCELCTYINHKKINICGMCGGLFHNKTQRNATENSLKPSRVEQREDAKFKSSIESCSNVSSVAAFEFDIIPATPIATEHRPEVKKSFAMLTPNSSARIPKDSILRNSVSASSEISAGFSISKANNEEREARLKSCKQKQMEFRARMAKRRSGQSSSLSAAEKVSAATSSKTSLLSSTKASLQFRTPNHGSSDLINSSLVSPIVQEARDKNVVLVDSKELSGSQPIITALRCRHNVHITVASLPYCDYIVGRGTAVERKMVSDMSQVSNRQKLVARFQQLNRNYDRVYLIIEQDCVKKKGLGQSDGRPVHSSCYTSNVCALSVTNVRILYSDNQDDTASILFMLATREKGLKREIDVAAAEKANDAKYRSLVRLYSSIPKVSYVSALYMCLNLKNFKEAASSSVEKLIQKAHLSTCAAAEVYIFFRRSFDLQMTPSG